MERERASEVTDGVLNVAVNRDAIRYAVAREQIGREREYEYAEYIQLLIKYLSENEQKDCGKNPIDFVSADTLFRGLNREAYEEIKLTQRYPVQKGQLAEEGVFLSNSPYTAFTFTRLEDGIIAVVDKNKLVYKDEHGIMEVGSEEYKSGVQALLTFLAQKGTNDKDTLYTINNYWDLSSRNHGQNPLGRTVAMRLPQPITATKVFLVLENGVHEEFAETER
ncbi:MAG: hypothetical protein AAB581_03350 [Patescibacteria group bacterium]